MMFREILGLGFVLVLEKMVEGRGCVKLGGRRKRSGERVQLGSHRVRGKVRTKYSVQINLKCSK